MAKHDDCHEQFVTYQYKMGTTFDQMEDQRPPSAVEGQKNPVNDTKV